MGFQRQLTAACLLAALSALALPALAHARGGGHIDDMAYGIVINRHGAWTGPEKAGGKPKSWVAKRVIAAHPSHLRVTDAASTCTRRECYRLRPQRSARRQLRRMRDAGIKLGAAINIARSDHGPRSVSDVVDHACKIKKADRADLYSWIFLDFASSQPRRHEIANKIKRGKGCSAGGWNVVTNSSGYKKTYNLANGALGHAKRFSVLVGGSESEIKQRLVDVAEGRRSAINSADKRFLEDVDRKYPGAQPLLKLEVPNQTGRIFAELTTRVQRSVLKRWSKAQRRRHFKVVYPLFVFPGNRPELG
jgi:hypothetical protein